MRITILNGNPDATHVAFDDYLGRLVEGLTPAHQVTRLDLREMTIAYCTGCWDCWVKTPGECAARDDSADVCRAAINADLLLLASPLRMGFISALLKKSLDKMIPLIHPYIVVDQGEAHHRARYDAYPLLGLLLERGSDADAEDVAITAGILSRTALNLKSRLAFTRLTGAPVEEVLDAIDCL
jgi:multimeric flavodoxin WrbA